MRAGEVTVVALMEGQEPEKRYGPGPVIRDRALAVPRDGGDIVAHGGVCGGGPSRRSAWEMLMTS
jgi:hypothetical protein